MKIVDRTAAPGPRPRRGRRAATKRTAPAAAPPARKRRRRKSLGRHETPPDPGELARLAAQRLVREVAEIIGDVSEHVRVRASEQANGGLLGVLDQELAIAQAAVIARGEQIVGGSTNA